MSEPQRILRGAGNDLEVALLRSAEPDAPSGRAVRSTLVTLGIGGGVMAAGLSTTAVAASAANASLPPVAAAMKGGGVALLVKWVGIAAIGGIASWGLWQAVAPGGPSTSVTVHEAPAEVIAAEALPRAEAREGAGAHQAPMGGDPAGMEPAADTDRDDTTPRIAQPSLAQPSLAKPADSGATRKESHKLSLTDEIAALDEAREAMAEDPDAALAALEKYRKDFKGGVLSDEAEVLRIESLARAGKKDQARSAASSFLATHPKSTLAARVRRFTN